MEKRYAFLVAFLVILLIAVNFYFFSSINEKNGLENVIISRVIDGDTVKLVDGRTLRLLNINSPEKDQPESILATNYLKNLYNKTIQVEIDGSDKYQRNLAKIYSNKEYINLESVKRGFSSKFLVNENELRNFRDAERHAIENSLGIWNRSVYYGCFKADINKYEEYVILEGKCGEIDMKGWRLKDESRKTYSFNSLLKGKIKINSGLGKDNSTDIFMQFSDHVWNDDRDSLYLFDENGGVAYYEDYGY